MNVILLEKVGKIGDVGEQVEVKAGFARNYLFPFAKAVPATKENVAEYEARKEELVKAAQDKQASAEARAATLNGIVVTIEANAGDEGKLFGSIGTRDIALALNEAGHKVEKSEVLLPEGALRTTGEFAISLSLGSEVTTEFTLKVIGTDAPEATIAAQEELGGKSQETTAEGSSEEESAVKDEE